MAVSFPYVSGACNSTDRPINMWPIESLNSYIYTQLVGLLRIAQKSASISRRTSTFTPQKLYKIPPIFGKIYHIIPLKIPSQRNINSSKLIKIKVIENNLKFFYKRHVSETRKKLTKIGMSACEEPQMERKVRITKVLRKILGQK